MIMRDKIIVRGGREHNLKNVHVEIPKNKLTVSKTAMLTIM